jgi:hypothetical protein
MVENLRDVREPAKDRDSVFARYFSPKRFTGRTEKANHVRDVPKRVGNDDKSRASR